MISLGPKRQQNPDAQRPYTELDMPGGSADIALVEKIVAGREYARQLGININPEPSSRPREGLRFDPSDSQD